MTTGTQPTAAEAIQQSLLDKAVTKLNEKDADGAVSQIMTLVKLVQTNNAEIAKLQESNADLLKKVGKLNGAGGLKASDFVRE